MRKVRLKKPELFFPDACTSRSYDVVDQTASGKWLKLQGDCLGVRFWAPADQVIDVGEDAQ